MIHFVTIRPYPSIISIAIYISANSGIHLIKNNNVRNYNYVHNYCYYNYNSGVSFQQDV